MRVETQVLIVLILFHVAYSMCLCLARVLFLQNVS